MMFGRGYYDRDRFFMHRDFYGITLWHVLIAIGVILLIISIVLLMTRKTGHNERKDTNENLKRILDERYVRGEITEEEYKTKKKFLDEN
ncbi:SHOCT domain-containing protein [Proteiniclasticum sp. SCR006]|uniref:SHOCT domain-containing protein n=1 Tax=Proteiniclasticum aestuarii TaxID=2817862 RepID=A0A939HBT7_9CLOT|nr:SHOCT domain-containing protein [Proteiniclasticum aestuarii]MBO1265563.1 SHOCT domain-containing protein [Proteiniclasticum aestuarii]